MKCFALLLAALAWLPLTAQEPLGPLNTRERNPIFQRFLNPRVDGVTALAPGTWQWTLGSAYANVFERESSETYVQSVDLELWSHHGGIRVGLAKKWELNVALAHHETRRGFLDHFIQEYHGLLNLPNDNREDVPNNSHSFYLGPQAGPALIDQATPVSGFSDPVFTLKRALWQGQTWQTSANFMWKSPWGSETWTSDKSDFGASLLVRRSGRRYHLHGQASWLRLGTASGWETIQRKQFPFVSMALERSQGRRSALVAQLDWGRSPFEQTGLEVLEDNVVNLTLGWRFGWGRNGEGQLTFSEDVTGDGPAVDFSLNLQFARKFNF